MSAEERELIYAEKRKSDQFIDGLIKTFNDEFDEKEVTVSAPKRVKYAYVR